MKKKSKVLSVVSAVVCGLACINLVSLMILVTKEGKTFVSIYKELNMSLSTQLEILSSMPFWVGAIVSVLISIAVIIFLVVKELQPNKKLSILINLVILIILSILYNIYLKELILPLTRSEFV